MRRVKIVATIGPATQSRNMLTGLINAGMDVARLNFSHGCHQTYNAIITELRDLSQQHGKPIALLQDLQGIKIRTGLLEQGRPVQLQTGQQLVLTSEKVKGNQQRVPISYRRLPHDVSVGDRILISDGSIELQVLSILPDELCCTVVNGGTLAENQGINIPGASLSVPPLTPKDLRDLKFGVDHEVDYVALSFIRTADDVLFLRKQLDLLGADIPIIAKLEKTTAMDHLEAILESCTGVMVARGDLGVEFSPERVPLLQKQIIDLANRKERLVITATQMLESMIENPRPTRAEASDVANAVLDGTDAVMLSGETAAGRYPIESVRMMDRIVHEAEKMETPSPLAAPHDRSKLLTFPQAVCKSAYHASQAIDARAIVVFTQTGLMARMMSKYRPQSQILGFAPRLQVARRMGFYWGVVALLMDKIGNADELTAQLERRLLQENWVKPGDSLVILTEAPIVEQGHTSAIKLHRVARATTPTSDRPTSLIQDHG